MAVVRCSQHRVLGTPSRSLFDLHVIYHAYVGPFTMMFDAIGDVLQSFMVALVAYFHCFALGNLLLFAFSGVASSVGVRAQVVHIAFKQFFILLTGAPLPSIFIVTHLSFRSEKSMP